VVLVICRRSFEIVRPILRDANLGVRHVDPLNTELK
jgi:hypothetical protein